MTAYNSTQIDSLSFYHRKRYLISYILEGIEVFCIPVLSPILSLSLTRLGTPLPL